MKTSETPSHTDAGQGLYLVPAPAVRTPTRARVVLLAEDDDDLRLVMECVLLTMGYRVIPAANGQLALAAFHRAATIDLLMTDYDMPGLSGVELARAVTEGKASMPVLFITGSTLAASIMQELADHGWAYLSKPTRVDTLKATLRSLLGKSSRVEVRS